MKKLLLLSLVTIGITAAATSARANGFGVVVTLGRPCPPICVGPVLPIIVPPPVVVGGCFPVYHRVEVCRDFRFHRDGWRRF